MGYRKQIYTEALSVLKARREQAEAVASAHKTQFAAKCPEALTIEREMAKTGLSAIRAVGAGKDAEAIIRDLAQYNLELQAKRAELLAQNGFPADYLQAPYTCKRCSDTGAVDGEPCDCYKALIRELALRELSSATPLKRCDFESFSLAVYADTPDENGLIPREEMEAIYEFCKGYAAQFDENSGSLFMYGKTGLGKTHLSLAIAAKVIEKGYGVIYGTAQNLLSTLEKEHFGRERDADTESLLLDCDLLILDDLGTEFSTGFTVAEIYNIVNTRGLRGKATIINSNLTLPELQAKYTDRVTSRILGSYSVLHFTGSDMRIQLR